MDEEEVQGESEQKIFKFFEQIFKFSEHKIFKCNYSWEEEEKEVQGESEQKIGLEARRGENYFWPQPDINKNAYKYKYIQIQIQIAYKYKKLVVGKLFLTSASFPLLWLMSEFKRSIENAVTEKLIKF